MHSLRKEITRLTSYRREVAVSENEQNVEVTPEMLEAGFRVLASSGIADEYLGADRLLVEEIYRAMSVLAPRPSSRRSPDRGS
jgi:hypothetical protein